MVSLYQKIRATVDKNGLQSLGSGLAHGFTPDKLPMLLFSHLVT